MPKISDLEHTLLRSHYANTLSLKDNHYRFFVLDGDILTKDQYIDFFRNPFPSIPNLQDAQLAYWSAFIP